MVYTCNRKKIKRDVKGDRTVSFSKLDKIFNSSRLQLPFNKYNRQIEILTELTRHRLHHQLHKRLHNSKIGERRYRIERWEQNCGGTRITNSWDDDEAGTNRV